MDKQFYLHIAFPEDNRLKDYHLYDWQSDFKNHYETKIHILAPLSLKTRKALYEQLKQLTDLDIVAILYPLSLEDYRNSYINHHHVEPTDEGLRGNYSSMQPAVETIDCDVVQIANFTKSLYKAVLRDKRKHPELDNHDSPHHLETISEHTIMVAEELVKMSIMKEDGDYTKYLLKNFHSKDKMKDINLLHTTALYHDLGKYWTKVFDQKVGHCRYKGHENVSAMIFVTEFLRNPSMFGFLTNIRQSTDDEAYSSALKRNVSFKSYKNAFLKMATQLILNHMIVKTDGYHPKTIKRRNLTTYEQYLLSIFATADNRGRITKKGF